MAHGGKREGAGRPRTRNVYVPDGKLTPVEFMLAQMRDDNAPMSVRMDAAKAVAPYTNAKLLSTALEVDGDVSIELVSYLAQSPDTAD